MKFSSRRAHGSPLSLALMLGILAPSLGLAQTAEPLLQKGNLVYTGAFALPNIQCQSPSYACFAYGGTALGYNSANNSLYVVGHTYGQLTAEVSIPALVNSSNLSALNTATLLQPFADVTDGKRNAVNPTDPNNHVIGGQLVYGGRLIVSDFSYYDGAGTQTTSHFARPLNLSAATPFVGPVTVGSQYPGFVDGYMTTIPTEWQSLFGGPALTGNCCLAIASIQSNGPALSVFDPAQIGTANPVAATPLVGYPTATPLGTGWGTTSTLYNGTTTITGVVFPTGTRSVLFFGRQGTGTFCYGPGTTDAALAGVATDGGADTWCFDPTDNSKGVHAYPYVYQVWAYDANDLIAVKNGSKSQYSIQPYATWTFTLPTTPANDPHEIGGAAYDAQNNIIYVSEECADSNCDPIIHAFKVTGVALPDPPQNLAVH